MWEESQLNLALDPRSLRRIQSTVFRQLLTRRLVPNAKLFVIRRVEVEHRRPLTGSRCEPSPDRERSCELESSCETLGSGRDAFEIVFQRAALSAKSAEGLRPPRQVATNLVPRAEHAIEATRTNSPGAHHREIRANGDSKLGSDW